MKQFDDEFYRSALHVYGSYTWHDDVFIVGTHAALKKLRDALTIAIDGNCAAQAHHWPSDGEGYTLYVAPASPETFDGMAEPYSHEFTSSGTLPADLGFDWLNAKKLKGD